MSATDRETFTRAEMIEALALAEGLSCALLHFDGEAGYGKSETVSALYDRLIGLPESTSDGSFEGDPELVAWTALACEAQADALEQAGQFGDRPAGLRANARQIREQGTTWPHERVES